VVPLGVQRPFYADATACVTMKPYVGAARVGIVSHA
jgi:hypothetical protein